MKSSELGYKEEPEHDGNQLGDWWRLTVIMKSGAAAEVFAPSKEALEEAQQVLRLPIQALDERVTLVGWKKDPNCLVVQTLLDVLKTEIALTELEEAPQFTWALAPGSLERVAGITKEAS